MITFPSSLQLSSTLQKLLSHIPQFWHAELRLGLQEALVNAVKHGNQLDPNKLVKVSFTAKNNYYWWVIRDDGTEAWSYSQQQSLPESDPEQVPESGRGIEILHRIFDQVYWDRGSRDLYLGKRIDFCDLPCIY
ncbi:MAG: ATP-binding protein [Pseudanabaenaceae cyanobacterium bins.68]|nr:ATP-binding protein [Pseudanabaenaceae cyanobacterium bins.68]